MLRSLSLIGGRNMGYTSRLSTPTLTQRFCRFNHNEKPIVHRARVEKINISTEEPKNLTTEGKKDSFSVTKTLLQANHLFQAGKFKEAINTLKEEEKRGEPAAQILSMRGSYHVHQKEFAEAQEVLSKALEVAPNHVHSLYLMGVVFSSQNQLSKAQEYFLKALQLEPDHTPSLFKLGMAYLTEDKYDQAEEAFQRATLFQDPRKQNQTSLPDQGIVKLVEKSRMESVFNLAMIYIVKRRKFDESLKLFAELLTKDPSFRSPAEVIAKQFSNRKGDSQAVAEERSFGENLNKLLETLPKVMEMFHTGKNLYEQKDIEGAVKQWKEVVKNQSMLEGTEFFGEVCFFLASSLHFILKKETEALPYYLLAIQSFPHNEDAWILSYSLLEKLGQKEEAIEHLQQAVDYNPSSNRVAFQLARALRSHKRHGQGVMFLKTRYLQDMRNSRVLWELIISMIIAQEGHLSDELITLLQKMSSLEPRMKPVISNIIHLADQSSPCQHQHEHDHQHQHQHHHHDHAHDHHQCGGHDHHHEHQHQCSGDHDHDHDHDHQHDHDHAHEHHQHGHQHGPSALLDYIEELEMRLVDKI